MGPSPLPLGVFKGFDEAVTHRVVVLGGGTGGTLVANRLRRLFAAEFYEVAAGGEIIFT